MNKPVRIVAPEQESGRLPAHGPARFTTHEFLRMSRTGAFEDMKVELAKGELIRTTPPNNEHGHRQLQVGIRLSAVVSEDRLNGETSLILDEGTVYGFDAAILRHPVSEDRPLQPDDVLLVVEIAVTTSSRDTNEKRIAYAAANIPHYWVVDTERLVVHVFADPQAGDYAEVHTVRFGAPLAVPDTDSAIVID